MSRWASVLGIHPSRRSLLLPQFLAVITCVSRQTTVSIELWVLHASSWPRSAIIWWRLGSCIPLCSFHRRLRLAVGARRRFALAVLLVLGSRLGHGRTPHRPCSFNRRARRLSRNSPVVVRLYCLTVRRVVIRAVSRRCAPHTPFPRGDACGNPE